MTIFELSELGNIIEISVPWSSILLNSRHSIRIIRYLGNTIFLETFWFQHTWGSIFIDVHLGVVVNKGDICRIVSVLCYSTEDKSSIVLADFSVGAVSEN